MDRPATRRFTIHLCAGLAAVAAPAASAPEPASTHPRLAGADGAPPRAIRPAPVVGQRMGGDDEPPARPPRVSAGAPSLTGTGVPASTVRRTVQRNIAQVRHCYEMGLNEDPTLRGRVVVHFVISPSGAVAESAVASSTLASTSVGDCVANAVRRWMFPAPAGGGVITVNYPFTFSPGG